MAVAAAAGLLLCGVLDLTLAGAFLPSLKATTQSSPSHWQESSAAAGKAGLASSSSSSSSLLRPPSRGVVLLYETTKRETEKELRNEIAARNSKVENEGQYAILDGAGMSPAVLTSNKGVDTATAGATPAADQVAQLDRLIRQRPYGLFLAEKFAEIVEDILEGVFGKPDLQDQDGGPASSIKKEKLVVLGTGWGAAAFLKGIDTRQYDVTVISPRNYFVFTPMLAGASVGTVDYRSITEPVREVRDIWMCRKTKGAWTLPPHNLSVVHFCQKWLTGTNQALTYNQTLIRKCAPRSTARPRS
jgi:hypothetical protein